MTRAYATRLNLVFRGLTASETFSIASDDAWRWAMAEHVGPGDRWEDGPHRFPERSVATWEWSEEHEGARRLILRHPDRDMPQVIWDTSLDFQREDERCVMTCLLERMAPGDLEARVPVLSVPRIVRTIIERGAWVGAQPAPAQARYITGPNNVEDFIEGLLLDPSRELPVVTVSPVGPERWAIERAAIESFARALAGIAWVVCLERPEDTYVITDSLGKQNSVYLGALRVYHPHLNLDAPPYENPVYFADKVTPWLLNWLRRSLVGGACDRFRPIPAVDRMIAAAQGLRRGRKQGEDEAAYYLEEATRLENDLNQEREKLQHEKERAADLEERLKKAEHDVKRLTWALNNRDAQPRSQEPQEAEVPDPTTAGDAVRRAREELRKTLVVTDRAAAAADRINQRDVQPAKVWRALGDLDWLVRRWQSNDLPQGFKPALHERGWEIKPTDPLAISLARGEYEFTYKGMIVAADQHLSLSRGERIYWYADTDQRVFVIHHVGAHLANATTG